MCGFSAFFSKGRDFRNDLCEDAAPDVDPWSSERMEFLFVADAQIVVQERNDAAAQQVLQDSDDDDALALAHYIDEQMEIVPLDVQPFSHHVHHSDKQIREIMEVANRPREDKLVDAVFLYAFGP